MLIAITVVQLLAALVLILIVLFQSGKSQGLSAIIIVMNFKVVLS